MSALFDVNLKNSFREKLEEQEYLHEIDRGKSVLLAGCGLCYGELLLCYVFQHLVSWKTKLVRPTNAEESEQRCDVFQHLKAVRKMEQITQSTRDRRETSKLQQEDLTQLHNDKDN